MQGCLATPTSHLINTCNTYTTYILGWPPEVQPGLNCVHSHIPHWFLYWPNPVAAVEEIGGGGMAGGEGRQSHEVLYQSTTHVHTYTQQQLHYYTFSFRWSAISSPAYRAHWYHQHFVSPDPKKRRSRTLYVGYHGNCIPHISCALVLCLWHTLNLLCHVQSNDNTLSIRERG